MAYLFFELKNYLVGPEQLANLLIISILSFKKADMSDAKLQGFG